MKDSPHHNKALRPRGVRSSAGLDLAERWKARARRKFKDAAGEKDAMGKRLIEHGAMCYLNAAKELEEALKQDQAGASPRP